MFNTIGTFFPVVQKSSTPTGGLLITLTVIEPVAVKEPSATVYV
jgi:uncharacterized membrane protein (DUF441 family)